MEEIKFKTGQEVLVRNTTGEWTYAVYSHYLNMKGVVYRHIVSGGNAYIQCIPYKGNENLVGTTDNPKEEDLPIDTPVMCKDKDAEVWSLYYYAGHHYVFCEGLKSEKSIDQMTFDLIIPFSKFNSITPEYSLF